MKLEDMETVEVFAVYSETGRLVQRLNGQIRLFGDYVFVPVMDFITGERFEPRNDLLWLVSEMEVLAWAAQ